jgi:hypothetical protein
VSFSSAMDQALQGIPINTASIKYHGETLRSINTNLQDPSNRTTDEMIGAVHSLASFDVSLSLTAL